MAELLNIVSVEGRSMSRSTVEHTSEAFRAFVGGDFETAPMGDGYTLVCNDDGMRLGLAQNMLGAYGRSFICKVNLEGLTDAEQTQVMERIIEDLLL